jgi:1-acyl-sn-glycerol-3-phosphate acyltransferase
MINDIQWDIQGDENLSMKEWYLVLSNHQSWADIVVLQFVLNNRIPYFRFFLKQELVWLPIFNFVWYALDYPYMKRYSKEFLKKNPHLKGKDIETTRKSCERFKYVPVSIMNFVEGTRFRPEKHKRQQSPFKHLLKPKAGGIAFVLSAMGEQLSSILDVTISYEPEARGLWDFLCGRISKVIVRIKQIDITDEILGDYFEDQNFRQQFQGWVNRLWEDKDQVLEKIRT